ncbi:Cytochrome c oxidase, subunit VB [Balamuthia mandrillaris]
MLRLPAQRFGTAGLVVGRSAFRFSLRSSRLYATGASSSTPSTPNAQTSPQQVPKEEEPSIRDLSTADSDEQFNITAFEEAGFEEELAGPDFLTGPFGTADKPVEVVSWFDSRIVGCLGGPGEKAHDLLWHEVRKTRPTVCLECGQYFALKEHPWKKYSPPEEHHDDDEDLDDYHGDHQHAEHKH